MVLSENFAYSGTSQNFDRDSYATLAEMKAVKTKKMPSIFHATYDTGRGSGSEFTLPTVVNKSF